MVYQKHDQNSRDVSNNYRKVKTKKTISTNNGKIDIKVRVKDILLTCCDKLKGISEALKDAFPNIHIQKCVIHQIRNSTKHISPKVVASFTSDMKKFINHQVMMQLLKHLILLRNLEEKNIHMLSNHEKIILIN